MKKFQSILYLSLILCCFSSTQGFSQVERTEISKSKNIQNGFYRCSTGIDIPIPIDTIEFEDLSDKSSDLTHVSFYGSDHILATVVILPVPDRQSFIFKEPSDEIYGLMERLMNITVIKDLKSGNIRFEVIDSDNLVIDEAPAYFFFANTPQSSKMMDLDTKKQLGTHTGGLFYVKNDHFVYVLVDNIDYTPVFDMENVIPYKDISKDLLVEKTKQILNTIKFQKVKS